MQQLNLCWVFPEEQVKNHLFKMGKYLDWKMIFSIQLCLFFLMENFCSDETFFFLMKSL